VNETDPSGLFGNPVGVSCSGGGTAQECRAEQEEAKAITKQECSNGGDCGGIGCGTWAIDCWYPLLPIGAALCIAGCSGAAVAFAGTSVGGFLCNLFQDDSGPVASTGRAEAQDLTEQLAMQSAKSAPEDGTVLQTLKMGDSRWPASEGWSRCNR
jgi:hypothetical protein